MAVKIRHEKKVYSFEENDKRLLLHSTENKFIDEQSFRGVSFKIFNSNFQDRLLKDRVVYMFRGRNRFK